MEQENSQLLKKLYEEFPTMNKNRILEFYLNIMLVLGGARPSFGVNMNPPKPKTRYDLLNVVLETYPDTFEIFKHDMPFIFLKSNTAFINSTLEKVTYKNMGIALGYCYAGNGYDKKQMSIGLSVMVSHIVNKTKTFIYCISVPTNILNETIMSSMYNDITNYNKILNQYGYSVYLSTDIVWLQNDVTMINCKPHVKHATKVCNNCK